MTTFEKCKAIREFLVRRMGDSLVYAKDWGPDFRLAEIDKIPDIVKSWETTCDFGSFAIQPADLTAGEMEELCFGKMSKSSPDWLIPVWLFPFLAEDIKMRCIDGSACLKKSEMDTDSRMGSLAYGIVPKDASF